jgi:hypothetical protein
MSGERRPAPVMLRRAFVSNESRRALGWWAGMVGAGVAALFVLEGRWGLAALCGVASAVLLWLGGFWVGPRSSDAYLRRLTYAWQVWAVESEWAYNNFRDREARYRTRIELLRPPQSYESDHDRVLAMLSDIERTRDDRSIAYPDRVRRAVAVVRAISATADELCASATRPDQRRFCGGLNEAREERRAEYRTAAQRAERATEELLAKLARLRPPAAADDVHAQILRGFLDYLEASRSFHAACRDEAPDEAARAATSLADVRDSLMSSVEALHASLDYDGRWRPNGCAEHRG